MPVFVLGQGVIGLEARGPRGLGGVNVHFTVEDREARRDGDGLSVSQGVPAAGWLQPHQAVLPDRSHQADSAGPGAIQQGGPARAVASRRDALQSR
jgi:hypothetical protein